MGLGRSLTALACLLALLGGAVSSPANASGSVGPEPVDPVISVLPPVPVPHQPYTGRTCRSGSPQCIVRVVRTMKQRLRPLARSCDHDAIFSLAYLRVTQNVKAAADAGYFSDRTWLTRLDAVFAEKYFRTLNTWNAGRRSAVPKAWQIALRASDDRSLTGLGDFLINMNAHINNDFPHALAAVGLTDRRGRSHKPDHNAYNQRLDSLYVPVFKEEARRFDPAFDDLDVGPFDETGSGLVMRGWREMVWRHAENLATAKTPPQRRLAEQMIEQYAASQAQMIKATFTSPDRSEARDAYCTARRRVANQR